MIKNYLKLAIVILFCCFVSYGQQINRIQSRCPSPYQLTKSQVSANANGDILYIPCTGQSSIFSGNVDFSGAVITGAVTGSGTVNYIPRWLTSTNNLANTPLSWNGTTYNFNNTALNSTFPMNLSTVNAAGIFNVGDTATAYIALGQATGLTLVRGVNGLALEATSGNVDIAGNSIGLIADTNNAAISATAGSVSLSSFLEMSFATTGTSDEFSFTGGRFQVGGNDCIGRNAILDGAGTLDISGNQCFIDSSAPVVIAIGITALGIIRVPTSGVITSSLGAGDAGTQVSYWIIDTQ